MNTWYRITNKSPECAEVMIYDEIGMWGITAKKFAEDLNAITAPRIELLINSPGGEVFQGYAIYSAIKAHPAKVAVRINGCAASIASVIACAGDSCTIDKNAYVLIHNPSCMTFGDAEQIRKEAALLDKLRDTIANTYAEKSGQTVEAIKAKMDDETWFDASEAVAFGLCDSIANDDDEEEDDDEATSLSASAAVAMKAALKYTNVPERLKRIAARLTTTPQPKNTEIPMLAVTAKENKHFVTVNGVEHEIGYAPPAPAAAAPASVIDPATHAQAITKAAADAVAAERLYATNFSTCMATAGLAGKEADAFRAKWYGRAIDDVKELASYAIGGRAKAVGEGGAGDEPAADPNKAAREDAEKRFAADPHIRASFGVSKSDPADSVPYKRGLTRFVDRNLAFASDHKAALVEFPKK